MNRHSVFVLCVGAMIASTSASAQNAPVTRRAADYCAKLLSLRLPDVKITSASPVDPATVRMQGVSVRHCQVAGVIGKEIQFVVRLPDDWNQRFFMGGGGGFVGSVSHNAESSLNSGYATAGTDTGHEGNPLDASWALDNPERQVNFGFVAVHRTAEVAKAIVRDYYGSDAQHSYFLGCSNGGRQGLVEALRYPDDFDGIVSVAPALDFTGVATSFVRNGQAAFRAEGNAVKPVVTPANLTLLQAKVLETCDLNDGVKDGVIENPGACNFKVASIRACPADRSGADCLTRAQRTAIEAIYSPTTAGGKQVYPGQPFGGEAEESGWSSWITGPSPLAETLTKGKASTAQLAFGVDMYRYFVFDDAKWNYRTYDLSKWAKDTKRAATILNATSADLSAYKASKGKLILVHGWSDAALSARSTIDYYEQLRAHDAAVRDYTALYLLPGVQHCAGGAGPDQVDWYSVISAWAEHDEAPDRVIAS
ncbi:MAG: tannase/feruloyl esterase family alpha/beta hydrolase, partial [Gemmatimonadaceae bacterium]